MNGNPSLHLWLIPLLLFIGFLLNGLLGRFLSNALVSAIALLFTAAPLAMVLGIAFQFSSLTLPHVEQLAFPWIETSAFRADFAFLLDPLTLVMLLIVTGVGFLIHIYSVGYMAHEEGYWRYFAYLNLFMFFMLTLVLAGELPADVRRLGGRRARLLPVDRLLLPARIGCGCRQEGVHP